MSEEKTILEKMEVLRLSNEESNKITKECIQTALVLLMKEQDFAHISITDIAKKAGVSRTAYYRNYQTKEDVLRNLLDDVAKNIHKSMKKYLVSDDEYKYWLCMFQDITPYAETAKLLFNAHFGEEIENGIYNMLIGEYTNPVNSDKYIERFWSGAVCAVIKQWLLGDMKESPENMATICCKAND